jgi:3-oxoadipate enol-lactonase
VLADLGEDLVALLDSLDVETAHVAGLSLGGMIGMWTAAHRPGRVRSLTLCCTSADLGPRSMWSERAELVRTRGMEPVVEPALGRWFTDGWRAANPLRTAEFRDMIGATNPAGYSGCCCAIETMDLLEALPMISAPTLVISGAEDVATSPEHGRRIVEGISGAHFEVVEGAAHLGSVEQPERFTELMLEHLKAAR